MQLWFSMFVKYNFILEAVKNSSIQTGTVPIFFNMLSEEFIVIFNYEDFNRKCLCSDRASSVECVFFCSLIKWWKGLSSKMQKNAKNSSYNG